MVVSSQLDKVESERHEAVNSVMHIAAVGWNDNLFCDTRLPGTTRGALVYESVLCDDSILCIEGRWAPLKCNCSGGNLGHTDPGWRLRWCCNV